MLPRFLGIGAQKAGTTWLHAMLSAHEEIWLPHLKELHYFDRRFPINQTRTTPASTSRRGVILRHFSTHLRRFSAAKLKERLSFRRWSDLRWEYRYLTGEWNDEWYGSLFVEARGRLAGEITPAYSCLSDAAISHVHELMPDTKLILLLRDPVDRAWSHAKMDLGRRKLGRDQSISDQKYKAHFDSHASRLRGDYLGAIRRWRTHFSESQLFLGFYDEILTCPEDLLLRIYRFLGVSARRMNLPPMVRRRFNAGTKESMPPQLRHYLSELYFDDARALAAKYGTYPQMWLERCELVLGRA
jgi:hypothetical protein